MLTNFPGGGLPIGSIILIGKHLTMKLYVKIRVNTTPDTPI